MGTDRSGITAPYPVSVVGWIPYQPHALSSVFTAQPISLRQDDNLSFSRTSP